MLYCSFGFWAQPANGDAMEDASRSEAKAVLVRLLARREYSQHELQLRLRQRGFNADVSAAAIAEVAEADWQSDQRFTEMFVRSRVERAQGPLKIRAELRARGVDDATVEAALRQQQVDWGEIAHDYLQRHERFRDAPLKARQALQRRGFHSDHIRQAMRLWEASAE